MTLQKNRNYNEEYLLKAGFLISKGEDFYWRAKRTTEIVVLIRNENGKYSIKI